MLALHCMAWNNQRKKCENWTQQTNDLANPRVVLFSMRKLRATERIVLSASVISYYYRRNAVRVWRELPWIVRRQQVRRFRALRVERRRDVWGGLEREQVSAPRKKNRRICVRCCISLLYRLRQHFGSTLKTGSWETEASFFLVLWEIQGYQLCSVATSRALYINSYNLLRQATLGFEEENKNQTPPSNKSPLRRRHVL